MNAYQEMQDRQQKEFNSFPCFFAFRQEQFDEGMKKLGLKPGDTKLIYRAPGGMYYRKTDAHSLKEMMDRFDREKEEAIVSDTAGDGFILDMFRTELANHEYGYTYELGETLDAVGLTLSEVQKRPNLYNGLRMALDRYGVIF